MDKRLDPDAMPPWLATQFSTRKNAKSIVAGVNDDDCAILKWGDKFVVATTDYLNSRPIALELGIGDFRTLGRLAVASNLADLCGSGAEPKGLLCAITMPRDAAESNFRQIVKGVRQEAKRWNTPVLGGDTKLGSSLALLVVAFGASESKRNLFLNYAARPGDLLWASGKLGSCNAAVLGLHRSEMSATWQKWAKRALTVPELPLAASRALSSSRLGNGGIDISDGLGVDLRQLCSASGVGVIVDSQRIPIAPQARQIARIMKLPPWTLAFGTGGDFQFLVTSRPRHRRQVEEMGFYLIGEINDSQQMQLRLSGGQLVNLPGDGHRDARNVSFHEEIRSLVMRAADVASQGQT